MPTNRSHFMSEKEAANVFGGGLGFKRVAAGSSYDFATNGLVCVAVKAMKGAVTFDASTSEIGDSITADDTLAHGDVLVGRFSTVAVDAASAGVAYCYYGRVVS